MSITYVVEETSWFSVIDPEAFKELCRDLDIAFQQDAIDPARFRLSAVNGEGSWPSYLEPAEQFERWPAWLPIPPEGEERIREITEEPEKAGAGNPEGAKEVWMTDPEAWPSEIEFQFFNTVIHFMIPGSHLTVRWCVFESTGHDLSIGGQVIYQDGRMFWVDFEEVLGGAVACVEDGPESDRPSWLRTLDSHPGNVACLDVNANR